MDRVILYTYTTRHIGLIGGTLLLHIDEMDKGANGQVDNAILLSDEGLH